MVLRLKSATQEIELVPMGAGALPAAPGPWPAPQGMIPTAPQGMIPTAPMVFMALTSSTTVQPHSAPLSANSPEKISAALAELGPAVSVRFCLNVLIGCVEVGLNSGPSKVLRASEPTCLVLLFWDCF